MIENRLLLTAEGRWLNWGDAEGYRDFDWEDQWVAAVGAQFAVVPKKLFLRLGYNYGANPVKANEGFSEAGVRTVQGLPFPNPAYESFRILGFPAIVEHHLTAGIGYAFSETFELNLGYMHAFENSISETSANAVFAYESSLSEDSLELGFTWRF
jgi:long-chain fatty acid transport protein